MLADSPSPRTELLALAANDLGAFASRNESVAFQTQTCFFFVTNVPSHSNGEKKPEGRGDADSSDPGAVFFLDG